MGDNVLRQLRESWYYINESKRDDSFCYMMYVSPEDEKPFKDLQKSLKLNGELIEDGKFHATIRFVKTEKDSKPLIEYLKSQKLPTIEATCKGFEIYGQAKDTLVIELDSKPLHAWFHKVNDWMIDRGFPPSEFPTYKPHISLTEKVGIEKPEWKKEYAVKFNLSIHIVTNSDYKEIYRSK